APALVLPEALASGWRVAATPPTGAEDLQDQLDDPDAVALVPADDVDAFSTALAAQLTRAAAQPAGMRDQLGAARERVTWSAYGDRYDRMIRQLDPRAHAS